MRPTDWRRYADRPYRDALACVGCGARKPPKARPLGWSRRYLPKSHTTEAHCPSCSLPAVGGVLLS